MATFKILDTFNITNRGYVLIGDIIDDGKISIGDFASIPNGSTTVDLRILGVEMVDKISQQIAHIGLVISTKDKKKIEDLNLKGMQINTLIKAK